MTSFAQKMATAFRHCERHPVDPKILITGNAKGVPALLLPDVKAVILRQPIPQEVADVTAGMTFDQIAALHKACSQFKGRFDPTKGVETLRGRRIFGTDQEAEVMGHDLEVRAEILRTVAENFRRIYTWFHGQLKITQGYHVDTIDVIRSSRVYRGGTVSIITADLEQQHYEQACAHGRKSSALDRRVAEKIYPYEPLQSGDGLYTKSREDGSAFGKTQSLVHCGVDTEEEGGGRIFSGMDLYKPEIG